MQRPIVDFLYEKLCWWAVHSGFDECNVLKLWRHRISLMIYKPHFRAAKASSQNVTFLATAIAPLRPEFAGVRLTDSTWCSMLTSRRRVSSINVLRRRRHDIRSNLGYFTRLTPHTAWKLYTEDVLPVRKSRSVPLCGRASDDCSFFWRTKNSLHFFICFKIRLSLVIATGSGHFHTRQSPPFPLDISPFHHHHPPIKKTGPLRLIWHNYSSSQHLLIELNWTFKENSSHEAKERVERDLIQFSVKCGKSF